MIYIPGLKVSSARRTLEQNSSVNLLELIHVSLGVGEEQRKKICPLLKHGGTPQWLQVGPAMGGGTQ